MEIDYGLEKNENFSIITMKHEKPFLCEESRDINNIVVAIECVISGFPSIKIPNNENEFFIITSTASNKNLRVFIKSKHNQALFANFLDLKKNIAIPKEKPKMSKNWQIIGFKDKIPFLSNKQSNGLNFPIKIPNAALPSIGELDINANPLSYDVGADFNIFLNLREKFNAKAYAQAIIDADTLLNEFPHSIFARDSLLYKIRALNELNQVQEAIELAKSWSIKYAADTNIAEILFIIGENYSKMRNFSEARYYFNRVIDEYQNSKFATFAQTGIAKNIAANGDKKAPSAIFAKAYQNAKDIDSASYVALAWAEFELSVENNQNASDLILRVANANPKYFLQHYAQSLNLFNILEQNKLYSAAAQAGSSILEFMPNEISKEKLMFDISAWWELANEPQNAHKINELFLATFPNSNNLNAIKARDDNLIFSLNEPDLKKKIAQLDSIINNYPNTPNAKKAYEQKASALYQLNRFGEILSLKNNLSSDNSNLKNAYIKLIESSSDCKQIARYFLDSGENLITNNANAVFQCLFDLAIFDKARDLGEAMLQNSINTNQKYAWLYNLSNIYLKLSDYPKAAITSSDACTLANDNDKKQDCALNLFYALLGQKKYSDMLQALDIIPNKSDKRMIEVYYELLLYAISNNDSIAIINYSSNILALQNRFNVRTHSPFVELNYANTLFNDNRFRNTLEVLENIFLLNLNSEESQKARYLRGRSHYELGDFNNAKIELDECVKIDAGSNLGQLCQENLGIL